MIISRRNILLGSASLPLTLSLSPNFINQDNDKNKNILILLHAKGGMDGLQLIAPSNDKYYRRARKNFGLFPYGSEKGLNLKSSIGNTNFLMNNQAKELYKLAILRTSLRKILSPPILSAYRFYNKLTVPAI